MKARMEEDGNGEDEGKIGGKRKRGKWKVEEEWDEEWK